jgi:hypothetical protein
VKTKGKFLSLTLAACSISLLSCGNGNLPRASCASGQLSINGDGEITYEKFPESTKEDRRDGKQKLADALASGNDYSLSVMYEPDYQETQKYFRSVIVRPISTVRYQFPDQSIIISAFKAPKSAFVPDNATGAERVPSAEMVDVVIESTGRMFSGSQWPAKLTSADWCIS